jgi:hypothetical protein
MTEMRGERPDIIEFLNSPAEDDPSDETSAWVQFMVCPECRAAYPTFYSPTDSSGTFCGSCGWASSEGAAEAAARHGAPDGGSDGEL